jgi:hypothetical protein
MLSSLLCSVSRLSQPTCIRKEMSCTTNWERFESVCYVFALHRAFSSELVTCFPSSSFLFSNGHCIILTWKWAFILGGILEILLHVFRLWVF